MYILSYMAELNIVELIENNPITRLSHNYNGKLLTKINTIVCLHSAAVWGRIYCESNSGFDKSF